MSLLPEIEQPLGDFEAIAATLAVANEYRHEDFDRDKRQRTTLADSEILRVVVGNGPSYLMRNGLFEWDPLIRETRGIGVSGRRCASNTAVSDTPSKAFAQSNADMALQPSLHAFALSVISVQKHCIVCSASASGAKLRFPNPMSGPRSGRCRGHAQHMLWLTDDNEIGRSSLTSDAPLSLSRATKFDSSHE